MKIPAFQSKSTKHRFKTKRSQPFLGNDTLRSVFEENFLEKKTILLPEDQYQALVELVGSPLTPQEIEGRKKLKKVPDWNL